MKVFTVGYEKRNIETFPAMLADAGVGAIVDVRETPWSHKPGFSKTALTEALRAAGIKYEHAVFAGNPKSLRSAASSPEACLVDYRMYLRRRPQIVDRLAEVLAAHADAGKTPCLLCFERLPSDCHRGILAAALARRGVEIEHLAGAEPTTRRASEQRTLSLGL